MAYDYGTQNIGGQNINLSQLIESGGDMSKILELLGLPSTYGGELGIPTLGSDVTKALDPNDPMYQQRITGLQQTAMPSLMQGALALGSGKAGGLGRGDRSFGTRQQAMMQPYLNQLTNVYSGISSDVGRAQGMASNWLRDVLGAYKDLDFQRPDEPTCGLNEVYQGYYDSNSGTWVGQCSTFTEPEDFIPGGGEDDGFNLGQDCNTFPGCCDADGNWICGGGDDNTGTSTFN
tara:strand:+ start:13 stop:711 length:699 start_codon:yes stop_codon:yes gene_type:complete